VGFARRVFSWQRWLGAALMVVGENANLCARLLHLQFTFLQAWWALHGVCSAGSAGWVLP
jgi:hypothetical protein